MKSSKFHVTLGLAAASLALAAQAFAVPVSVPVNEEDRKSVV